MCVAVVLGGCSRQQPAVDAKPARASLPAPASASVPSPAVSLVSGEAVYNEHCATCHMADGYGVPNMQPALVGSPIVAGEPTRLYTVIRAGSAALRDRPSEYGNEMPPFAILTEAEARAVAGYVRQRFGRPSS